METSGLTVATTDNDLNGVTATSSSNAWAVGDYRNGTTERTLIEHWNGTAWRVKKSPSVGLGANDLKGVAATSSSNAWAVGDYHSGTAYADLTLIEHWNGTAWRVKQSPNVGTYDNYLYGVTATSSSNAWAVGSYYN